MIANVYVEASFGKEAEASPSTKSTDSKGDYFPSTPENKTTTTRVSEKEEVKSNTWTIYKKLPREQSTYKIRLT